MRVFKDQASLAPDFASLPPEVIKKVYDNLDYQSANDLERTSKTIRTLIYDEQKRRREFLREDPEFVKQVPEEILKKILNPT